MSNSVVGALRVNLGLDSAQFQTGLKQAASGLERFASVAKVGIAAAAAAVAASVAGIGYAVKKTLDEADKMGKAAQSIGVPVDELSRLKHAADLSGVSFEGLQKGMQRLGKSISEGITNPTGEAGKTFSALGVNLRNTDGSIKNSSQVMSDLAAKFADMPDGAQKTAVAMQLLGRAGADMIPLLNSGRDGLQSLKDEADQLGIVIDSRTARAAESFNDNLSRLGKMVEGVWTQLTAALAPALASIVQYFTDAAKESNGFGDTIKMVGTWAVEAAMMLMDGWHGVKLVFLTVTTTVENFRTSAIEAISAVQVSLRSFVRNMASAVNTARSAMNLIPGNNVPLIDLSSMDAGIEVYKKWGEEAAAAAAAANRKWQDAFNAPLPSEKVKDGIRQFSEAAGAPVKKLSEELDLAGNRGAGGVSKINTELQKLQAEGQRVFDATRTPIEAYNLEIERLSRLLQAGAIDQDTFNRAVDRAAEKLDKGASSASGIASSLSGEFSSAFTGLVDGTKKAEDAVDNLLKSMLRMATNRVFSSIFGMLFGGGPAATAGGSLLGGLFGGIGKNAQGTDNWRGGMTWVGERGPELVNLPRGSQVIPNHEIGAGGSNVVYAPTIDARGADPAQIAALRAEMRMQAANMGKVIDGRLRSSELRRVRA